MRRIVILMALASALAVPALPSPPSHKTVLGTWTGSSTCMGNRPACKNEVVVYRFEAVPKHPELITLLADKILEGKRVPMGKLDCTVDDVKGTVTCEFTRGTTHGIWAYSWNGDAMEGTLHILPERTLGRTVKARRVQPSQVPPEPSRDQY